MRKSLPGAQYLPRTIPFPTGTSCAQSALHRSVKAKRRRWWTTAFLSCSDRIRSHRAKHQVPKSATKRSRKRRNWGVYLGTNEPRPSSMTVTGALATAIKAQCSVNLTRDWGTRLRSGCSYLYSDLISFFLAVPSFLSNTMACATNHYHLLPSVLFIGSKIIVMLCACGIIWLTTIAEWSTLRIRSCQWVE